MTLTQLRYIIAVDNHRHFATAAEKCYVTQPTLSMQIRKLEEEVGITIFDRSRNPVVPTQKGRELIEKARAIIDKVDDIQTNLNAEEGEVSGTLRVGVIPTIAPYLIPRFLKDFTDSHPKVNLVFEESITEDLLDKLNKDQLDLLIIATPSTANHHFEHLLYYEPFVGYISPEHPLAEKSYLQVDDLRNQHVWLLQEGHCFRDQTVKLCQLNNQNEDQQPIQFESGNLETLKRLVEQNFGLTLLPYLAINENEQAESPNACIRYFKDPIPQRKVRLVYSRKHLKQQLIKTLKNHIVSKLPSRISTQEKHMLIE